MIQDTSGPRPQAQGPSSELSTPPGPGALAHGPDQRTTAGPWLVGAALLCLGASAVMWVQTRAEIATLRGTVRTLASEVAALRRDPIVDVSGAPARGREDQVVTMIEFSDYECPFCIRHFTQTMPLIQKQYIDTGRIRYVFRDFPIDHIHPYARKASEAARCAGDQGKYWQMHDLLFQNQQSLAPDQLPGLGSKLGLDATAFNACLSSSKYASAIQQNFGDGSAAGVRGTPSFVIGRTRPDDKVEGVLVVGARPLTDFRQEIDRLLSEK